VLVRHLSHLCRSRLDRQTAAAERELLGELSHYRENSRLSCQVEITQALSGLKVTIAEDE
jgi:ferredoxin